MQSTHKIAGGDGVGFAAYLTSGAARGDYYLGEGEVDGEGRWHGSGSALASLGLSRDRPVEREELLALMRGVSPASGEQLRRAGGDGSRVAGVDLTFSAPKSVSALWAISGAERREQIEAAHRRAVASAIGRIEREVELVRSRRDGVLSWERARSLVAAEFVHTSSRLTRDQERDGVPDPQLHSHVVVLGAQRRDGRFAAVDSRELFRSARANGAWYRGELAANLQELGLRVQGSTGNDRRYFEVQGVPASLGERWSRRGAEIEHAAREFRTRYGRDPRGGELSSITVGTRGTKTVAATVDVNAAWRAVGEEYGLGTAQGERLFATGLHERQEHGERLQRLGRDLLADLDRRASMVSDRDLHARAYELSAGVCRPEQAQGVLDGLERSKELLPLEGGMWSTRQLRELEQHAANTAGRRAGEHAAPVTPGSVRQAAAEVERQIGGRFSGEQRAALEKVTGQGGVCVLVGQAGTGKGVVIRASTDAWQREGHTVVGTAVAGATAERLAADAHLKSALTTDSLLARIEHGTLTLNDKTVVVMDEAGMADTRRLSKLMQRTEQSQSKLLLVGDSAQLSPVGAGGLFDQIRQRAPTAELTEIRRARHGWERDAWQQIRQGNAQQALADYHARGRLHIHDTRQQAAEKMVAQWDQTRRQTGLDGVVMLTDASNRELDQINALAQQARDQHGELGQHRVPLKDRPYALATGDRIIFTQSHPQSGNKRVENGTIGTISHADKHGRLTIDTNGPNPRQVSVETDSFQGLKLAYAQHVYKAQGLTTQRALVLTGGWQTDRERAYVALTRATERTDIHIARSDLGQQNLDPGTIQRLAETINQSNAQQASISRQEQPQEHDTPERSDAQQPLSEIGHILVQQEAHEQHQHEQDRGYGIE